MKKTGKKLLGILLSACMVLSQMGTVVWAEDEATGNVEEIVTVEETADIDLPDNDELFAGFVEEQLYGYDMSTFGTQYREDLNDAEKGIYDALKEKIEYVALNGGSTEFVLDNVDGLKTTWTNTEMGVEGLDVEAVKAEFAAQYDLHNINVALLYDCPFDLYWYNKSIDAAISNPYSIGMSYKTVNGVKYYTKITFTDLTFKLKVAGAYQGSSEYAVTSDATKVKIAKETALSIKLDNEGRTDLQKLTNYKDTICNMVSYNHTAADDDSTPYGDPWQLIYVFDGDSSTNVVCEGYAKAFQYLCDMGGLDCISTSGVMTGATGSGRHMWNVVTLNDKNYLVDVTNCDSGTVGYPDKLFMVGAPYSNGSYTFACGSSNVIFTPDDGDLDLATEAYVEEVHTHNTNGMRYEYYNDSFHYEIKYCVDCPDNYTNPNSYVNLHSTTAADDLPATTAHPAYCSLCESYYGEKLPATNIIPGCNLTWDLSDDGTLTISGEGAMTDFEQEADFYMCPWEELRDQILHVVIEEGVTSVGTHAFKWTNVQSVSLPSTLNKIGEYSFYECNALETIDIPEGVEEIPMYAFCDCDVLTSANIPSTVTSIGFGAFYNCASLATADLPANLTSLGESAFSFCDSLEEVVLPDGLTRIENETFTSCTSLAKLTLSAKLTSIGDYAFSDAVITEIVLPETLKTIGDYAFSHAKLTKVVIPASVEELGYYVFGMCTSLEEIVFEGDAPLIDAVAFAAVTADAYYPANDTTWTEDKLQNYGGTLTWQSYETEDNSVLASGTLDTIEGSTMTWELTSDGTLTISGSGTMVDQVGSYEDSNAPWREYLTQIKSIVIEEGVTGIGDCAFYNCSAAETVSLPSTLTETGMFSFFQCSALKSVVIPDSVTELKPGLFKGCSSLISAEIPETVTAIWSCVFDSCTSLVNVEIPSGLTVLDECAFYRCESLKEIVVPDGITEIADQVFEGCYSLESVTLPAVNSLGYGAFTACISLKSIGIPETVTSIGERAFFNCSALENVTLPAGLTTLGDSAFTKCAAFTEIVIPDGVTRIENYMFSECENLSSVTLPANLTYIGERAFYECALTSVELPDTVAEIGDSAFRKTALTSITVPAGIQTLPNLAFGDCSSLTEIIFEGNAPEIDESAFRSVTADAYYPANDTTWTEDKLQNYGGTLTWQSYVPLLDSGTIDGCDLTWTLTSDGTLTISGEGEMSNFEWTEDYRSTCPWDEYNELILSVVVEEGVTSIGDSAFYHFQNVRYADLPETVTRIGAYAFDSCGAITELDFPTGLKEIGLMAFQGVGFTEVVIPDGVTRIEEVTFNCCGYLKSVTIPAGVTYVGKDAFMYCSALEEVIFEGSAPEIASRAFNGTTTTVYYPADDDSWTVDVMQDYGGTLTWIPVGADAVIEEVYGDIAYEVEGSVVTVEHTSACKLGYLDGESYVAVEAVKNADGTYSFTLPDGAQGVVLVMNGDLNGNGAINSADTTLVARSQLLSSHPAYLELTAVQKFAADINGNGTINSADTTMLARSQLLSDHAAYQALNW